MQDSGQSAQPPSHPLTTKSQGSSHSSSPSSSPLPVDGQEFVWNPEYHSIDISKQHFGLYRVKIKRRGLQTSIPLTSYEAEVQGCTFGMIWQKNCWSYELLETSIRMKRVRLFYTLEAVFDCRVPGETKVTKNGTLLAFDGNLDYETLKERYKSMGVAAYLKARRATREVIREMKDNAMKIISSTENSYNDSEDLLLWASQKQDEKSSLKIIWRRDVGEPLSGKKCLHDPEPAFKAMDVVAAQTIVLCQTVRNKGGRLSGSKSENLKKLGRSVVIAGRANQKFVEDSKAFPEGWKAGYHKWLATWTRRPLMRRVTAGDSYDLKLLQESMPSVKYNHHGASPA